jgi:uncharacterized protein YcfJ
MTEETDVMYNRKYLRAVALLCCVALVLPACETTGGSVGSGALLGGAAGAIIGHQSGHALEGAAIGAAIGALAGYAVHQYNANKTRDAETTRRDYDYDPADGFELDVRDSSVYPRTVEPGDMVTAKLEYATLGTGNGVRVTERQVLQYGDRENELDKRTRTREDGTWETTVEFSVPDNAPEGDYELAQRVTAEGETEIATSRFQVREVTAALDGAKRYEVTLVTD